MLGNTGTMLKGEDADLITEDFVKNEKDPKI